MPTHPHTKVHDWITSVTIPYALQMRQCVLLILAFHECILLLDPSRLPGTLHETATAVEAIQVAVLGAALHSVQLAGVGPAAAAAASAASRRQMTMTLTQGAAAMTRAAAVLALLGPIQCTCTGSLRGASRWLWRWHRLLRRSPHHRRVLPAPHAKAPAAAHLPRCACSAARVDPHKLSCLRPRSSRRGTKRLRLRTVNR